MWAIIGTAYNPKQRKMEWRNWNVYRTKEFSENILTWQFFYLVEYWSWIKEWEFMLGPNFTFCCEGDRNKY